MSAERDVHRIVRSWLRTDEHESADAILGIVLSRLDTTPQRRSWWPARRSDDMNRISLAAVAAVVILAVGFVGYRMLPAEGVGAPSAPPISHASSPPPTTTPGPAAAPMIPTGLVPAGTYSQASYSNTRFEVTVPAGWTYDGGWLGKGDPWEGNGVVLVPWIISHVYGRPCDWQGTLRQTSTKDQIVDALFGIADPPRSRQDTLLGRAPRGYPAARLVFSLPEDADVSGCDGGITRLWPDAGPDESGGLPLGPGQTTTVYVVETGGKATAIVSIVNHDSDPAEVAELAEIVNSIWIPRT